MKNKRNVVQIGKSGWHVNRNDFGLKSEGYLFYGSSKVLISLFCAIFANA